MAAMKPAGTVHLSRRALWSSWHRALTHCARRPPFWHYRRIGEVRIVSFSPKADASGRLLSDRNAIKADIAGDVVLRQQCDQSGPDETTIG